MARSALIIDVFISSPGDVSDDRKVIIDAAQSWNQRNSKKSGIFFNPLTWESKVSPSIGAYSQDVINSQIGDDYDLLIGLMWHRYGTPTASAESGTQEEFDRALSRYGKDGKTNIAFIFKTTDPPFSDIDPDQLTKVRKFKDDIGKNGCFYREYRQKDELYSILNLIFDGTAENYAGDKTLDSTSKQSLTANVEIEAETLPREEFGIFDHIDQLTPAVQEFEEIMDKWVSEMNSLSEKVSKSTDQIDSMSKFGKVDIQNIRPITTKVTEYIEEYCSASLPLIINTEAVLDNILVSMAGIVEMSEDFNTSDEERAAAKLATLEFMEAVEGSSSSLKSFNETLEGLPRMDKKFNRARNTAVSMHDRFLGNIGMAKEKMGALRGKLDD